jgi:AcrR family transcriptional regulator
MPKSHPFLADPDGTREEIMRATYLALCEYGYAGLTIERIGEEFPKSKSLIYHHHDGKDDLLLAFLEFMLERFEEGMPLEDLGGPAERLDALLDYMFATPLPDRRLEFTRAMVELRAQAAHYETYRDEFSRHDRYFRRGLTDLIEEGVEEGVFRTDEPEAVAATLLTLINGSLGERATTTEDTAGVVRKQVDRYVQAALYEDS